MRLIRARRFTGPRPQFECTLGASNQSNENENYLANRKLRFLKGFPSTSMALSSNNFNTKIIIIIIILNQIRNNSINNIIITYAIL